MMSLLFQQLLELLSNLPQLLPSQLVLMSRLCQLLAILPSQLILLLLFQLMMVLLMLLLFQLLLLLLLLMRLLLLFQLMWPQNSEGMLDLFETIEVWNLCLLELL